MNNSNSSKLKIVLGVPIVLIVLWLLASLYLTSQSTVLIFNNTVSWAPIPNFGYKLEFLRDSKDRAISVWTFENPQSDKVILYLHGNSGRINDFFVDLKKYGTVVSPAYPGYHESEGTPDTEGVYEAALLAYDDLVKNKGVSPKSIVIMGHSMGGSPAVYVASQRPEVKKLILINTFSSIRSMCERQYSILCGFTGDILPTTTYAPKVTIPVRQFVYKGDLSVPPAEGNKLFDNFTKTNDKKLFQLDKYTHTYPDLNEVFVQAEEAN
jgi:pimeloyl-ACP methyl ester carboxylesterase